MLATLVRSLPRAGYVYEPKWDGFRALVFKDGSDVDIRSRNDKKLARYFPELVDAVRALGANEVVLDGEIVVAAGDGLDFAALMSRLHPATSRVDRLRDETPAAFVAFDLLAIGDADLRDRPFSERRARLEVLLGRASANLLLTPATADPDVAEHWLARFRSRGIDGVIAKSPSMPYSPGRRTMVKVKHELTADVVVAGARFTMAADPKGGERPIVGSLLLGLHDERGQLVHIGVVSQLTRARRAEMAAEVARDIVALEGHPWEGGFGLERSPLGRLAGSAGRWSPDEMVRDWVPLRPTRVCEIAYDTIDDHRLRYPARFLRWRPDRVAASCGFDQLDSPPGAANDPRAVLWPAPAP
jgi:ATP-dependent DNA ligase